MFSDIQFTKFHQKCREIVFHGSYVSESEHYQTECRNTQKRNVKCILLEWRLLFYAIFNRMFYKLIVVQQVMKSSDTKGVNLKLLIAL